MKNKLILCCAAAGAALLAGCGSSGSTAGTTATAPAAKPAAATGTQPAAAGGGVVISTKHSKLGTILAGGPKHLTVYLFEGDSGTHSGCTGACAAAWPPVTTGAAPVAAAGASGAQLGTATRADGTTQVTYNGHPLYFFAKDKDDGDAYGQDVKAFGADWYVVQPNGSKLDSGS